MCYSGPLGYSADYHVTSTSTASTVTQKIAVLIAEMINTVYKDKAWVFLQCETHNTQSELVTEHKKRFMRSRKDQNAEMNTYLQLFYSCCFPGKIKQT